MSHMECLQGIGTMLGTEIRDMDQPMLLALKEFIA